MKYENTYWKHNSRNCLVKIINFKIGRVDKNYVYTPCCYKAERSVDLNIVLHK
jgi:hypothetical protein